MDGICIPGNPCETDADCRPDETCVDRDGSLQCVPDGETPCSPVGEQDGCPDGFICAPNGVCVDPGDVGGDADADADADADGDSDTDTGYDLTGGTVQGGACSCRAGASRGGGALWLLVLAIAAWRRRQG